MKKGLLFLVACMCSLIALAEDVPSMIVWNVDNQSTEYALSDIRKIVFNSADEMTIVPRSGEEVSYALNVVDKITFMNVTEPTAIEHIEVIESGKPVQKLIRDGHLLIIRDGQVYDVMGRKL